MCTDCWASSVQSQPVTGRWNNGEPQPVYRPRASYRAPIGLGRLAAAQRICEELLTRAREAHRSSHEASALGLSADIASARNDNRTTLAFSNSRLR